MFINRQRELGFLRDRKKRKGPELIIIYGKRRVGKTELVKQFFKDIPHVYFLADKTSEHDQLKDFSERIALFYKDDFLASRGFGSWGECLAYLGKKGPLVLAIDEFPYLIESNPAVPSLFQKGWDEHLAYGETILILLGSSIGMMETEVLGHKSPLFGRRTGQLLVDPLSFAEAHQFFPRLSQQEFMPVFATLGGMPAYLKKFDPRRSFWKNVREQLLQPEAYLFAEPEFILREELREPRNYFSILRAMSQGKTRVSEIINETGFDKSLVGKYLSVLLDLRIIRREIPITEKIPEKSKKGLYFLSDPFFRFWFKFVFPNKSFIEEGDSAYVLKHKLKPDFDLFVSQVFEDVCRDLVRSGTFGKKKYSRVGRWWTKDAEIDVVAIDDESGVMLFGEAKWSTKKVGIDILEDLQRKAALVDWNNKTRQEHFVLFSRSGFTDGLTSCARKEKVILYSF
ncbi:MAG: ATP-binding protein [Candidatus Ozemobacteraceae bacterium]